MLKLKTGSNTRCDTLTSDPTWPKSLTWWRVTWFHLWDAVLSEAKSFGLVWGLAAIWCRVCIHQINRVNSHNVFNMMTAP